MPVRAGRLRHRVTVEAPTETQDSYGQPVLTWSDENELYAEVRPLRGQEKSEAQTVNPRVSHKVLLRWQGGQALLNTDGAVLLNTDGAALKDTGTDITPQKRLRFNGRILNVVSAINRGEKDELLELECIEEV